MFENNEIDMIFGYSSVIADVSSTYLGVSRFGADFHELNIDLRKSIAESTLENALLKSSFKDVLVMGSFGLAGFLMDDLIGMDNCMINFHHAVLYGFGGLKYCAATSNFLLYFGMDRAASVVSKPLDFLLSLPIIREEYD